MAVCEAGAITSDFQIVTSCGRSVSCAVHIHCENSWKLQINTCLLLKILFYLWGRSSPPAAFPVELHFPVLISTSGCGKAMAWLMVHIWGLFHPAETKEESRAQEVQEHPAGGTSPLSATFLPDFGKFQELIKTRISDIWHINLDKEASISPSNATYNHKWNSYFPISESNKIGLWI